MGNALELSENSEKNNISRNVIHAKRRQYEETTAEDHALVSSELKGEGKAEREREKERCGRKFIEIFRFAAS